MLNIYVCEDDNTQRDYISKIIENFVLMEDIDLKFILSTSQPHQLLDSIKENNNTGLYFLDIDLKSDINGLVLAQEIRKMDSRGFIVFVTTHSEMSYMTFSYKVEAMDFIIKDNMDEIHDKIHKCIIDAYTKYSSPNNECHKIFKIETSDKDLCTPLDDIYYFETSENIHKVVLHTQNAIIEFQAKLKDIEPLLDNQFCRCHRSYIVNKNMITDINLKERIITLKNNETVLASRQGIKKVWN